MPVSGRTIADDVVIPHHTGSEITVVLIKTGVRHGHGLSRAVEVRGEVGRHGVRAHVTARLVVERTEGRVGPKLHHSGLTKQGRHVGCGQRSLVSAAVPSTRIVHGLTGDFTELLLEQATRVVGQGDELNRAVIVSPTVQAEQGLLQDAFSLMQEGDVE